MSTRTYKLKVARSTSQEIITISTFYAVLPHGCPLHSPLYWLCEHLRVNSGYSRASMKTLTSPRIFWLWSRCGLQVCPAPTFVRCRVLVFVLFDSPRCDYTRLVVFSYRSQKAFQRDFEHDHEVFTKGRNLLPTVKKFDFLEHALFYISYNGSRTPGLARWPLIGLIAT